MRLWNFGCGPLAAIGLLRIRDLGTTVQFRVGGLAAARRGMRHIRHRLLRMLRRVVPVKMHADHGWYNVIHCKTRALQKAHGTIYHGLFCNMHAAYYTRSTQTKAYNLTILNIFVVSKSWFEFLLSFWIICHGAIYMLTTLYFFKYCFSFSFVLLTFNWYLDRFVC